MRRLLVLMASASVCLGCVVSVGGGRVEVRQSEQQPAVSVEVVARAAALAVSLAGPLRALEASLGRWQTCLRARQCSGEEFLQTTESELLGILAPQELAPLRDWVEEGFSEAREDLASAAQPGVRLAAMRQDEDEGLLGIFRQVLDLVRESREMAEQDALLTNLCVVSAPVGGARFELWPRSDPGSNRDTVTAGSLVNLYRGLYSYQVEREGYRAIVCNPQPGVRGCPRLNLVEDPQPIFACDLRQGHCTRKAGPAEACDAAP